MEQAAVQITDYPWMDQLLGAEREFMTGRQIRIIQAAIELFTEKGYSGTTTREIACKAEVAEATIFKHYRTKKELMMNISSMMVQNVVFSMMAAGLDELFEQPYDNLHDFMTDLLTNRIAMAQQGLPLIRLLIQEVPFQPEIRQMMVGHLSKLPIMEGLERLKEAGLLIERPAPEIGRFLISSFFGFISTRYILLPEFFAEQLDDDLSHFVDYMVQGLAGPAARDIHVNQGD